MSADPLDLQPPGGSLSSRRGRMLECRDTRDPVELFPNKVIELKVNRDRDEFIDSIERLRPQILRLASTYHGGEGCYFFQPPIRGTYNICYFVHFQDGPKWVVRIPLEPCLAWGGADKLESEVATMKVVAERTTIPIPRIIAYQLGQPTDGPLSSFLILEYVEARQLTDREFKHFTSDQSQQFFDCLADFFIQLRGLEFDNIGSLSEDLQVTKPPVSISTNTAQLEGLEPYKDYCINTPLRSAKEYTTMRKNFVGRAFMTSPASVPKGSKVSEHLLFNACFRSSVDRWRDGPEDDGPFVLVHGDFEPKNLLVNDHGEIVSVLDWEFSRVVPLRYFLPPFWLRIPFGTRLLNQPLLYDSWLHQFKRLLQVIEEQEMEHSDTTTLHGEWLDAVEGSTRFLMASALENWTEVCDAADGIVFRLLSENEDFASLLDRWMRHSIYHQDLLATKRSQSKEHEKELAEAIKQDQAERARKARRSQNLEELGGELGLGRASTTPLSPLSQPAAGFQYFQIDD